MLTLIIMANQNWKKWLKTGRFLPLMTAVGAISVNLLALFGLVSLTVPEGIIIILLGLLAIDALVERINILERIEQQLDPARNTSLFRRRKEILKPHEHTENPQEICILGLHGNTVVGQHPSFYLKKLQSGCQIRVALLNFENRKMIEAIAEFGIGNPSENQRLADRLHQKIVNTLDELADINRKAPANCQIEIRLSQVFVPYGIFAVNLNDPQSGSMTIEYFDYQAKIDERPHIRLTAANDPEWFNYYRQQFEKMWEQAKPWPRTTP